MGGFGTDGTERSAEVHDGRSDKQGTVKTTLALLRETETTDPLLDSYSEMGFCEASPSLNTTAPSTNGGQYPTPVVGASNKEMGTTDENYLVHQFLITLKCQFESIRHFLLSWRLGRYFSAGVSTREWSLACTEICGVLHASCHALYGLSSSDGRTLLLHTFSLKTTTNIRSFPCLHELVILLLFLSAQPATLSGRPYHLPGG
ncbi:hypothetical protein DFJ58DRAFT_846953 [Suillus subalutaceus]|uniref:uncharacterized protein n=1 Tax=Suillus subalutaceus TaxID=48586 RepID=UPI001B864C46|nr:uncharacterized protein DFJ58DRAFT_846953 [Suillus subalutaceus]KAG1836441.1 hypothetical protein DFJ58DRAFT_846953 [Suillus subalutaceus]